MAALKGCEARMRYSSAGVLPPESATVNDLPLRGYASHGEGWSAALALRLACYELLSADGAEPVLILDDVFAELDTARRDQLATIASKAARPNAITISLRMA